MTPSDDTPLDPVSAAEAVARVIYEIDAGDDECREILLSDLMCAAWGSVLALSQ
jgi:hypothetical protein